MQTKKSDYQELKKSICKNYLKGVCSFGKECKYRHPPKQRNTMVETEVPVCRYFLQNNCRRGDKCPYVHIPPKPENLKPRSDWLTFCLYFPSGSCKNKDCRFLHITDNDKDVFRTTGKIGPHILEQAMCKALLQDVAFNGTTPTCKEYLQGHCKWMSCPMHHLTRQEFSQAVLHALNEKFSLVIGPKETYLSHSANGYDPSVKYQESLGYDSLPAYKTHIGHDRYVPAREKYVITEPYRNDYGNEHNWHDRRDDHDQQNFISSETDRIIKGIYNLMKGDANLIRNAEKQEITDLRGKLDNLAEENARYRYEFSQMNPFERERYKLPMHPTHDKNNLKYQDIVRRLEKENYDMRWQLSMLQEQEHKPHYMGKPEPLYLGRQMMEQEHRRGGGGMRGPSHPKHSMRGEEDRWYGSDAFGAHVPPAVHVPYYNPLKQKVNNQLRQNMVHQYKGPQQMNQGASQYTKVYQKSQKHNQQINRKSQQQFQKTQKLNPKVNPKKKQESQNSNQAKSVKPKKVTKSESDKEDNVPKVETEGESSVVEMESDKEDKNESSQDIESRVVDSHSDKEDKNENSQEIESHVELHSDKGDKNESSQEIESHVESHSDKEDNKSSQEIESHVESHSDKDAKKISSQEIKSHVESHSDNESSQEIEVRIRKAGALEAEDCSNMEEKEVTSADGNQEHDKNKDEMKEESENTSKDADTRQERSKIEKNKDEMKEESENTSKDADTRQEKSKIEENKDEMKEENTSKDADTRQEKSKIEKNKDEMKEESENTSKDVDTRQEKSKIEENKDEMKEKSENTSKDVDTRQEKGKIEKGNEDGDGKERRIIEQDETDNMANTVKLENEKNDGQD